MPSPNIATLAQVIYGVGTSFDFSAEFPEAYSFSGKSVVFKARRHQNSPVLFEFLGSVAGDTLSVSIDPQDVSTLEENDTFESVITSLLPYGYFAWSVSVVEGEEGSKVTEYRFQGNARINPDTGAFDNESASVTATVAFQDISTIVSFAQVGPIGAPGLTGPAGATGAAGPNEVTTATDSGITGLLKGAAGKVAQAVAGTDYVATNDARLTDSRPPTAHSHEGAAILSTGETGGIKFLREDGDGTSSWQTISGGGDALVANNLNQFADVTQTATKTLAISESTTLAGGTHSGTNTGDQDLSGYVLTTAIDTLAELNAIITDATLVDTTDSRLSDSRTPTSHTHDDRYYTETETDTLLSGKLATSQKGSANGLAELDAGGLVPSSQLPSYVDDVIEAANFAALPGTGVTGKIYVTLDTNLTYRWSGSAYVEISASLALGETSSTAYRGDRGKTAYDHAQLVSGNPHNVTAADIGVEASADVTDTANVGLSIHAATAKSTLADGDKFSLIDSEASNVLKTSLWSVVKDAIKTYYDTVTATLTNKTLTTPVLTNPTVTNYVETIHAPAATAAITLALTNGTVQKITSNGNLTVTLPASAAGKSFQVRIHYGGTHTLTWAGGTNIRWAGGTAPTPTSVNGKVDIFNFVCDGTNTYGAAFGLNFTA